MLVFAAITPHSPLLIPEIGRDNMGKCAASIAALKELEGQLYVAQPETVVVITPPADDRQTSFVVNFAPQFSGNFAEFGHLNSEVAYRGDNEVSYSISERLKTRFPVQLTTIETLDYNTLVPLHYLLAHLKQVTVAPLASANRSLAEQVAFGAGLVDELAETSKRVAVIASAETAHTLSKQSPAGFKAGTKRIEDRVVQYITRRDTERLCALTTDDIARYGLDELTGIALLLGVLGERQCAPRLLAHESPFGIGFLAVNFEI